MKEKIRKILKEYLDDDQTQMSDEERDHILDTVSNYERKGWKYVGMFKEGSIPYMSILHQRKKIQYQLPWNILSDLINKIPKNITVDKMEYVFYLFIIEGHITKILDPTKDYF